MGIIEIQIQAPVFLAAQLAGLQARKTCPPGPMTINGVSLVVHQIDFVANSLRHEAATFQVYFETSDTTGGTTASGLRTQVAQNLILHVSTQADVLSHPNQPPQSMQSVPVTVILNLDYLVNVNGGQCFFRLGPSAQPGAGGTAGDRRHGDGRPLCSRGRRWWAATGTTYSGCPRVRSAW